jgi:hypothetical protein
MAPEQENHRNKHIGTDISLGNPGSGTENKPDAWTQVMPLSEGIVLVDPATLPEKRRLLFTEYDVVKEMFEDNTRWKQIQGIVCTPIKEFAKILERKNGKTIDAVHDHVLFYNNYAALNPNDMIRFKNTIYLKPEAVWTWIELFADRSLVRLRKKIVVVNASALKPDGRKERNRLSGASETKINISVNTTVDNNNTANLNLANKEAENALRFKILRKYERIRRFIVTEDRWIEINNQKYLDLLLLPDQLALKGGKYWDYDRIFYFLYKTIKDHDGNMILQFNRKVYITKEGLWFIAMYLEQKLADKKVPYKLKI